MAGRITRSLDHLHFDHTGLEFFQTNVSLRSVLESFVVHPFIHLSTLGHELDLIVKVILGTFACWGAFLLFLYYWHVCFLSYQKVYTGFKRFKIKIKLCWS